MAGKEQMYHVDISTNLGESNDDAFRPLDAKGNEMDQEDAIVRLHAEANMDNAGIEARKAGAERAKWVVDTCRNLYGSAKSKFGKAMGFLGKLGLNVLGADKYWKADLEQTKRDGRQLSETVRTKAQSAGERVTGAFNRMTEKGAEKWTGAVDLAKTVWKNGRETIKGIQDTIHSERALAKAQAALDRVEEMRAQCNDTDAKAEAMKRAVEAGREEAQKIEDAVYTKHPQLRPAAPAPAPTAETTPAEENPEAEAAAS